MADRRTWLRVALAIVVVALVARFVAREWTALGATIAGLRPDWGRLALASLAVVAGYAVLVQAWRHLVATWGGRLALLDATRIWFVSSLGKWIPGKVVAIGAMAVLAREAGVSAVAATGSAVVMQLVNLAAGFALVGALGSGALFAQQPLLRTASWGVLAASVAGILAGPWLLARTFALASRVTGRELPPPPAITRATLAGVTLANVASWLAYGVGFHLFAGALLGRDLGDVTASTVVWTASYLVGYLTLVAPGGLGAREVALTALLAALRLATPAEAAVLAGASRLWLLVLEIVPGLAFLPGTAWRRRSTTRPPDGPTP